MSVPLPKVQTKHKSGTFVKRKRAYDKEYYSKNKDKYKRVSKRDSNLLF